MLLTKRFLKELLAVCFNSAQCERGLVWTKQRHIPTNCYGVPPRVLKHGDSVTSCNFFLKSYQADNRYIV